MKNNMRFIMAAIILALVAALGFSHGVWAGQLNAGTVPSCPTSGVGGTFTTCNATITGINTLITDVPMPTDPNGIDIIPAGSKNDGPAVSLLNSAAGTVLCFPDPDVRPVFGDIFFWNTTTSTWVYVPSFSKVNPNMTCIYTFTDGIYTIEY